MAGMSKLSDITNAMGVKNLSVSGDPKAIAAQGFAPPVAEKNGDLTVTSMPTADADALRKSRRRGLYPSILGNDGTDTLG